MRDGGIVIKLSEDGIAGGRDWGFDPDALNHIAEQVLQIHRLGVQVGVVVGGGRSEDVSA